MPAYINTEAGEDRSSNAVWEILKEEVRFLLKPRLHMHASADVPPLSSSTSAD